MMKNNDTDFCRFKGTVNYEPRYGCFISINWKDLLDAAKEDWQKQALEFFVKEYGDKYYNVEISW